MSRRLTTIIAAAMLASASMSAQKVTFTPQWVPQAQFAGYYVAYELGFYEDEGLDVTIKHLNANTRMNIISYVRGKQTDFFTTMALNAMIVTDGGLDLVNVLQTSQNSALCCAADKPVSKIEDLDGLSIGRWSSGFGESALIATSEHNLNVQWMPSLNANNLFLAGALDGCLCYSFNEIISLYLSTGSRGVDHVLRFSDIGYNYPEDGLFVTREYYENNKETVDKFVRASIKGWEYSRNNPEEALDICMKFIRQENVSTNRVLQRMMLEEILRLQQDKATGAATYAPVSEEMFGTMLGKAREAGFIMGNIDYNKFIAQ